METKDMIIVAVLGLIVLGALWYLGSYVVFGENVPMSGTLGNAAPQILAATLYQPTLSMGTDQGGVVMVVEGQDTNGALDINLNATTFTFWDFATYPGGPGNAQPDNNNLYKSTYTLRPTDYTLSIDKNDPTKFNITINYHYDSKIGPGIWYYANPTLNASIDPWTGLATICDSTNSCATIQVNTSMPELVALTHGKSIKLGTLNLSQNGCDLGIYDNMTHENAGNTMLNIKTNVTDNLTGTTYNDTIYQSVYVNFTACQATVQQTSLQYTWALGIAPRTNDTLPETTVYRYMITEWRTPASGPRSDTYTGTFGIEAMKGS